MVVIDTNVALVASKRAEQASEDCVVNCVERLEQIINGAEKLALDDQWKIIGEYQNKLDSGGQGSVGDRFLRWVLRNRNNIERIEYVSITPIMDENAMTFEEFPNDPALQTSA